MASTPLDLPILISQLPNMQQIAGANFVPHEAQQALFGQMVAEQKRKEEQKVQETEKKDGLEALDRDHGGNTASSRFMRQQRNRQKHEPDPQPDSQSSNASPWTGNIINVKI